MDHNDLNVSNYMEIVIGLVMSPPSGSGDILFFPVHPSVCLFVTNRVSSIT